MKFFDAHFVQTRTQIREVCAERKPVREGCGSNFRAEISWSQFCRMAPIPALSLGSGASGLDESWPEFGLLVKPAYTVVDTNSVPAAES